MLGHDVYHLWQYWGWFLIGNSMLVLSGKASWQQTAPFTYPCCRDYFSVEFGRESYDMTKCPAHPVGMCWVGDTVHQLLLAIDALSQTSSSFSCCNQSSVASELTHLNGSRHKRIAPPSKFPAEQKPLIFGVFLVKRSLY